MRMDVIGQLPPNLAIGVVIPAYRVENEIGDVLANIPAFIKTIIVVNDASPDAAQAVIERHAGADPRILPLRHAVNQGVGGAMITGFLQALKLDLDIIIKLDGDGQMDPNQIPDLIAPLLAGQADFTKGTRFKDKVALKQMPIERLLGNLYASFMAKAATGYWNLFDPTNGYFAIRVDALRAIDLNNLARDYLFETSLLSELYHARAVARDVSIPAIYADENSSINYARMVISYPSALARYAVKRVWSRYFLHQREIGTVYLTAGVPLTLLGLALWISRYTNTVITAVTLIIGAALLFLALWRDLRAVPRKPISTPFRRAN